MEQEKKKWSPELIKNMMSLIGKDKIVPIIGYGAFSAKVGDKEYKNIHEYIVRSLLEEKENKALFPGLSGRVGEFVGMQGMEQLRREFQKKKKTLSSRLASLYEDKDFQKSIVVNEEVIKFLSNGRFPLIISATNFGFFSKKLSLNGYDLVSYQKTKIQDLNGGNIVNLKKTVFSIFGTVESNEACVITEDDFLQYLHALQDSMSCPNNLQAYLRDKFILTIGCEIPDWTFRFLLYSLKATADGLKRGDDVDDQFFGGVVHSAEDKNMDMERFLTELRYIYEGDSWLKDINGKLSAVKRPSIFLSMVSEEYDTIGEEIMSILKPRFDIWFFKYDGDVDYWNKIEEGIQTCRYFMPVVTPEAINRIYEIDDINHIQKDKDSGLIWEWQIAIKEMRRKYEGKIYSIPYFYGTNRQKLTRALEKMDEKEEEKQHVWPLFKGIQDIPSCSDLSIEKVLEYVKEDKGNE